MVQLSHLYMTAGKKIQLRLYRSLSAKQCLWLLILTKFVIVILPQSKCHLISWLYLMVHSDFGAQDNKICHCFHFFPFYLPWSDGIPAELSQILKCDAVKVLQSIHQKIWKTQQWPQDWKRSVFILIPKKGNAKECSNYHTIVLISHASKIMLKILQARLQQYMNWEVPNLKVGFREYRGPRDKIAKFIWL